MALSGTRSRAALTPVASRWAGLAVVGSLPALVAAFIERLLYTEPCTGPGRRETGPCHHQDLQTRGFSRLFLRGSQAAPGALELAAPRHPPHPGDTCTSRRVQ